MGRDCDVAIVGGGIVGLAAARELRARHPHLALRLLEREHDVAQHQTGHSSGVVHAGIYYAPGSLKARLCVEGARLLYEFSDAHGVPYRRSGKVVVATREDELPRLDEIERRGRANGVESLRRVGPNELAQIEPHVRGIAALHSPGTGVVDFREVGRALAVELAASDVPVVTGARVTGVAATAHGVRLRHAGGAETGARYALFCAGLEADRLAVAAGAPRDPAIVPFRGAYLRLRPQRAGLVRSLVYPVPDPALPFLGVHATRGMDGEVLLGPTALLAPGRHAYRLRDSSARDIAHTLAWPGTWRMARRWWRTGFAELHRSVSRGAMVAELRRYLPGLEAADVTAGPAGVRAQALARDGTLLEDFALSATDRCLHVRNAPSPAATSALALARLVADRAAAAFDL